MPPVVDGIHPGLLRGPLNNVTAERDALGEWGNTTYCRFMDRLFGHPSVEDNKAVMNPFMPESQRVHPYRPVHGVTPDGLFVVLRSTVTRPSRPEDCVAFMANTGTREIRAFAVEEVIPFSYYTRCATYVLSAASVVLPVGEVGHQTGAAALEGLEPGEHKQPVILDGAYNSAFRDGQGREAELGSIASFHLLLERYKKKEQEALYAEAA